MQAIENASNDRLAEFKHRLALYQQEKPYRGE
jgi:hypothetical protein